MSDAPSKSPEQERADRLDSLRSRWNTWLADRSTLGQLSDEIEDMSGRTGGLSLRVEALRKRGYVYGRGWENQAGVLKKSWPERRRNARRILEDRKHDIRDLVKEIEDYLDRARLSEGALDRLENLIDRAESQIESAESAVRGAFDSLEEQLLALETEFDQIEATFDKADSASFKFFPEEHCIAACSAVWISDKQEPEGVLFLTDGRVVFEQREKKALKKVLFITTKSEMVQEKLWEAPIGAIAEVETEEQKGGFLGLGSKELLILRFRERTRELPSDVTLRLKGMDNAQWQSLIKRVQTGEIESDRFDAAAPAEAEEGTAAPTSPPPSPAEIPTKCPTCGGQLPTIYKGMREVTCEYCGNTVRF